MEAKTYQGWSNYETWAVALWLDNSEGEYMQVREWTRAAWDESPAAPMVAEWNWSREEAAACQLADQIREHLEDQNPITDASVFADLLNGALAEVNWHEIARHYLADVASDMEVNNDKTEHELDEQHENKGEK